MKPEIKYLSDDSVDHAVDAQIRGLMTACFIKPQYAIFKTQRYLHEPNPHWWTIGDGQKRLIAQVGVHEKQVMTEGNAFPIGGICSVCVHPDYRGRSYVKLMLERVHAWLSEHGFDFAVLFGSPLIYGSSGYVQVDNLVHGSDQEGWKPVNVMVFEVSATAWPDGQVRLPGPTF